MCNYCWGDSNYPKQQAGSKSVLMAVWQGIKTLLLVAAGLALWGAILYAGMTGLASH